MSLQSVLNLSCHLPMQRAPPFPADFKYLAGGILSDLIVFYTTVP